MKTWFVHGSMGVDTSETFQKQDKLTCTKIYFRCNTVSYEIYCQNSLCIYLLLLREPLGYYKRISGMRDRYAQGTVCQDSSGLDLAKYLTHFPQHLV